MDKYEYKVRVEEIKQLIAQQEYAKAADIADTIDWRRVKSVMMLCTISDLYKINRRYEDARNLLLLAYERRPGGRTICYSLCELSIKTEEYVQAVEYYKEFVQIAPKDAGRYILQYKLYEAQDVSLEERIEVLEELKKRDYREKWAYELAYLYHRIGLATRCVEECDELILWFGEGKYVIKAMELKMLHQPLTPAQQLKYDNRFGRREIADAASADMGYGESMQDNPDLRQQAPVTANPYVESSQEVSGDTKIFRAEDVIAALGKGGIEDEIQVKTLDVGQYNTMNLQAELAEGLKEILGNPENNINDEITKSIVAPMLESDTETLDLPVLEEEPSVEDVDNGPEVIEESEVFFGETGEIGLETIPDSTGQIVLNQIKNGEEIKPITSPVVEPPKELANVLSQEADGQISLVMPDSSNIEKQITGQINLEEIMLEWERMKKESEEKRAEEVRQHVLEHTGTMFTEFESAVRDGLLEKIEAEQYEESKEEAEDSENTETSEETENAEEVENEAEVEELIQTDEPAEAEESSESEELAEIEEPTEAEELAEIEELSEIEEQAEAEELAEIEELSEIEEQAEAEELAEIEELSETEEPVEFEKSAETESADESEGEITVEESDDEFEDIIEIEEAEETEESADTEDEPEYGSEVEDLATDVDESEPEAEVTRVQEAPKPVVESAKVIDQDKATIRALTREEKELFAPFAQSKKAKEQLVKAIDNISLAAYTGNIIITGEEGIDTLSLAKNMIKDVQMNDSNFSGKVAKISGSALNKKNVDAVLSDLNNGALIVLKASELDEKTSNDLHRALQQESRGIIIVLEDTKKAMKLYLDENKALQEAFTARMDVEALSNDTLVAFGKQYARQKEYSIDDMGVLALHTRIEELQTSDHVANVVDVKKIVDEAIRHANKKSIAHFFDILLAKRYDDEDMIILGEKDFT